IAGGQVGCNYQTGNWVFGVEGDAHAQRWQQSDVFSLLLAPPFVGPGSVFSLSSDWQASARGRIGYAMNRTLFYGTAGAAWTQVRANVSWVPFFGGGPAILTSDTRTLLGVTVGAGVEHAVTDNFTLGLEGRYTWYDRE